LLNGKRIVVVMPAYNAAKTLSQTYSELPRDVVDDVIVVDDGSSDETVRVAQDLGLIVFRHGENMGYGKNQKTCYREALKRDALLRDRQDGVSAMSQRAPGDAALRRARRGTPGSTRDWWG